MRNKYSWLRLYGFFAILVIALVYFEQSKLNSKEFASTSLKGSETLGEPTLGNIWVSKPDGSDLVDWDEKSVGKPLEEAQKELVSSGISVLSSGKSRNFEFYDEGTFMPSGVQNTFLISEGNLKTAEALGFRHSKSDEFKNLDCSAIVKDPKTAVIYVFGQSNSANSGRSVRLRNLNPEKVYNFFGSRCYRARNPMAGATVYGGKDEGHVSPWPLLGQKLVASGKYSQVLFVTLGWGGTRIQEWAPGGNKHSRIVDSLAQLRKANIIPTHFLWAQGESDSNPNEVTPQDEENYVRSMKQILGVIRGAGFGAPIYLAHSTAMNWGLILNDGRPKEFIAGAAVTKAIDRLIAEDSSNFKVGANTDEMGADFRFDYAHMNEKGLEKAVELWYSVIE